MPEQGAYRELVTDPDAMRAYQDWVQLPITRAVQRVVAELAPAAIPVNRRTGEQALYHSGETAMHAAVTDVLTKLNASAGLAAEPAMLESTYGAVDYLKTGEPV